MLLATKLMLDWIDEAELAVALENAIAGVIAEGTIRTYDMSGENTTLEMASAVAERL
jgi:isocitrate/isopropylmalate dehydrogenase